MGMFARVAIAVLVALAPVRAPAADPDATALAERATTTAQRATSATDPAVAAVAAFEAHNLWRKAHDADGDESHLCAARSLLTTICARQDLDSSHRVSLERSRDALGQLRCARPRRPSAGPPQTETPPAQASAQASAKKIPTLGVHDRERPLIPIALGPQLPPPIPSEHDRGLADADSAQPSGAAAEQRSTIDLDSAQPRRAGLQIGGGISLALGLAALGVMTPFAARDASFAREIRSLTAIKNGAGGTLTEAQDERLTDLVNASKSTFRASLALGLTGGVATLLGAGLLIAGQRRSTKALALVPGVDRNSASITFQGRF